MKRISLLALILVFTAISIAVAAPTVASATANQHKPNQSATDLSSGSSECDPDNRQESGAIYRICMPPAERYNNQLVIWAHGYVDVTKPIEIPESQLCIGSFCIPDITNALGFGFATTSYSVNGLAIKQGVSDILDLVDIYTAQKGKPDRVLIIGASEGGLVTTLLTEQYPNIFVSGLAMCAPIGDFQRQINYFGDVRVIFNYFFPDLGALLGSDLTGIPPAVIENWPAIWAQMEPIIFAAENASKLDQLVKVTKMPHDPNDYLGSLHTSVEDALWYNVFGTNDAKEKLGGNPFDNITRRYRGSDNDSLLNQSAQRVAADEAASVELENYYQTGGDLHIPLVTLHTLQDQQVPYWHEPLYGRKLAAAGNQSNRFNMPINRYEHCNFTPGEALAAFGISYYLANQNPLAANRVAELLPNPVDLATYEQTLATFLAGHK